MLTAAWPPVARAGTHRPLRLAERLPNLGWRVTVLTPTVTRNPFESQMPLDFDLAAPDGVDVIRPSSSMPIWRLRRRLAQAAELVGQLRNFQRVANRISLKPPFFPEWTNGAIKTARVVHQKTPFDAVWVTGGPWGIFLTAQSLARTLNIPLVLDYRDPWTANPDRPNDKGGVKHRIQRQLESKCVESAKAVAYVHPRCLSENMRIFGQPDQAIWRVIYNGYVEDAKSYEPLGTDTPTVIHGGHCYGGRSATPVLEALAEMTFDEKPRVRFFGNLDTHAEGWLKSSPAPAGFEHRGLVSSDEIKGHMRGAAAQLLIVGPEHAHAVPSKIFDYMKANKPVIGIGPAQAEVRKIIEACQLGIWCESGNRAAIIDAFGKAKSGTIPYVPDQEQIEKFSADNMAKETSQLLHEAIA